MTKKLVIIHTVSPLVEVFQRLAKEILPGVQVYHVLDEPLLEQIRQSGNLQSGARERLIAHVRAAEDIDADAVLVSCSTVSPYLDEISARIPVVKIDDAMIEQAVARGRVIGLLATNPPALEPSRKALEKKAAEKAKPIVIHPVLIHGAFLALMAGDGQIHDQLLRAAIEELGARVDLIVLAQASMARVLESKPDFKMPIPILSSPDSALRMLANLIEE